MSRIESHNYYHIYQANVHKLSETSSILRIWLCRHLHVKLQYLQIEIEVRISSRLVCNKLTNLRIARYVMWVNKVCEIKMLTVVKVGNCFSAWNENSSFNLKIHLVADQKNFCFPQPEIETVFVRLKWLLFVKC